MHSLNAHYVVSYVNYSEGLVITEMDTCFTEISSNRPKNTLDLRDGRGKFKETAGRVCFQEILSDQVIFLEAKHAHASLQMFPKF